MKPYFIVCLFFPENKARNFVRNVLFSGKNKKKSFIGIVISNQDYELILRC